MSKRYLVLADGHVFEGTAAGADGSALGEMVFTTGMGGYVETLTDPSYYGQIILQTFPLIGNYGMIPEDAESVKCHARGYVARELCDAPCNFRARGTVDAYLRAQGVPAVCGIDTRQVTRVLRDAGVMGACITDDLSTLDMAALRAYRVTGALQGVSTGEKTLLRAQGETKCTVALLDYGVKNGIERALQKRGCDVMVLPYDASAEDIMSCHPDGLMLSNGPGDPAENAACIDVLRHLLGKLPIFGVCLGHQLLALAAGGHTVKLKFGHRGANQPVRDALAGHMHITSQNHGYAVDISALPVGARVTFVNANDGTCEGLCYPDLRALSVQFHPEACAGPRDTSYLFDDFLSMLWR